MEDSIVPPFVVVETTEVLGKLVLIAAVVKRIVVLTDLVVSDSAVVIEVLYVVVLTKPSFWQMNSVAVVLISADHCPLSACIRIPKLSKGGNLIFNPLAPNMPDNDQVFLLLGRQIVLKGN